MANEEVKKWLVSYDHKDGRKGTVEVTTKIADSEAFNYGNRKCGILIEKGCDGVGYDLRYAKGNLHMVMIEGYFGSGLVNCAEA